VTSIAVAAPDWADASSSWRGRLWHLQARCAGLGASAPSEAAAVLTARELEVLKLIAQGFLGSAVDVAA